MANDRVDSIERQLRELGRRLERLEGHGPIPGAAPATPITHPPVEPRRTPAPAPGWSGPSAKLEELLGGRVLAWLGGSAILLGIVFFLGMAISRGWIDEPTRTVIGLLGSSCLLAVGIWLYERQGRVEAALAAVASALSGLFATTLVATQIYDLIPVEIGLAVAALVGVVAVAIAVRWDSTVVAAIGIVGALLAPVLVGAEVSNLSLMFMAVALVAAVGVLLWRRWDWLSLGAFLVSSPQLLAWLQENYSAHLGAALLVLVGFGAIYAIAAIGYEMRARSQSELPVASWFLLLSNVVLVAGFGYYMLDQAGHPNGAVAWLLGLSGANIGLGAFALRQPISREIGSLLVAIGLGLSAFGFADALDGPALVAGWALQAIALAFLATRARPEQSQFGSNAERLLIAAGIYLGLAFGHSLLFEGPPNALFDGVADLGDAVAALGMCAFAALVCARLFREIQPRLGEIAELAGAIALVYLGSVVIVDQLGVSATGAHEQTGQVLLSAFWTVTGLGAVIYGLVRDARRFRLGGLALLGVAIAKVYTYDLAELDELARVFSFIALGLLLLAGAFAYQRIRVSVFEETEVPR